MPKKSPKLEGNVDVSDLTSLTLDDESLENLNIDEVLEDNDLSVDAVPSNDGSFNLENSDIESGDQGSNMVDESVFLDSGDNGQLRQNLSGEGDNLGKYLRRFFISSTLTLLGVIAIAILYLFNIYIKESSSTTPDTERQSYVNGFKDKFTWIKNTIGINNNYESPKVGSDDELSKVSEIINATDIDYIEKKDLLSSYVSDLVRNAGDKAVQSENLKQNIAKQGFLPEELGSLLSEDQAIDTIQRSLNALEVIKFSTATRVFSYMNTALSTISEMIRISGVSIERLRSLFEMVSSRGEKDISSYVYMCYLNPFEVNANCDAIGDLDLYYKLAKDESVDIDLFKNAMNAISQLLEKEDTSLFSITFNGFNAEDKRIQFNIEVYTSQEDEKALMAQGKRNPNIFILTNIINLLKQSSFIIGAEINPKEINVEQRTLNLGGITRPVNYSTMDFTVSIQKNTEREIFDYIDLDSLKRLLLNRGFNGDLEEISGESLNLDNEENDSEHAGDEGIEDLEVVDTDNTDIEESTDFIE